MKGIWLPDDDWRTYLERNMVIGAPGDNQGKPLVFSDVPWFIKPLEKFFDYSVRVVDIIKAVGVGGTGIGECVVVGNTARRGTPLLYSIVVDESKLPEVATRLFEMQLDRIEAIRNRYDQGANSKRREYMRQFRSPAGVEVKLQLAKESNFTTSRAECIINDETWRYDAKLWEMAASRNEGDFAYPKTVNISSAPESEDHPAHQSYLQGDQDHYHFGCPNCGKLFEPLVGRDSEKRYNQHRVIQFDTEGSIHHRAGTVKMVCPHCQCEKGIFTDTLKNRRRLLEGADYLSMRKNSDPAAPDHYSCQISGWIAWWKRWGAMLTTYLRSRESLRGGDPNPIKMYYIQNEAHTWKGQATRDDAQLYISGDYSLIPHDRETREPIPKSQARSHPHAIWHAPSDWEYESARYIEVDYQRVGEFWVEVVQATDGKDREGNPMPRFPMAGGSRLMWAGIVETYEQIETIREYFEVDPGRVGIDCGTDTKKGNIYENIVKYGWRGLAGAGRRKGDRGYRHKWEKYDAESGKTVTEEFQAPYSVPVQKGDRYYDPQINDYRRAELIHWDKNWVTDTFDEIRQGKTDRYFGLPDNLHELDRAWPEKQKIKEQFDSMEFTAKGYWDKKTSNAQEHLWDTHSQALVFMWMEGYFDVHPITGPDFSNQEPVQN